MSDPATGSGPRLETRLADSLAGVGERSPHPGDLAAGARDRLRRRRRTTATVVAAAAAVVAIPVGLTVVGAGEGPDRRETTVSDPVPGNWRVETWHDLTLRVPPEWGWGAGTDWCAHDESADTATPVVSRPEQPARTLGCAPSWGYGVHFFEPRGGELPPGTEGAVQQYEGRRYPYGSWLGYTSTGRAAVWVVTDSRKLTRQVLDSTEAVGGTDPNGCPPDRGTVPAERADGRISVCRYGTDSLLEQSELLSPQESDELRDAVNLAPGHAGTAGTNGRCRHWKAQHPVVSTRGAQFGVYLVFDHPCPSFNRLTDDDGVEKELTADIMYWALSPGWSGSVAPGVPLPGRLRTE